jgi:hypothetical protein
MALTDAERQARHRDRKQQRLNECVTRADVDRAVAILYEACRYDEPTLPPYSEWIANLERQRPMKAREGWAELVPESGDPDDYHGHLSLEDRQFLARVGAVIRASRWPARHR